MVCFDSTIYALATPPGIGALAVLRISGPQAMSALSALAGGRAFSPRVATLAPLRDPRSGVLLDSALVTVFQSPHSFTGEDVVEVSLHGGRAVIEGVLSALAGCAALRPAEAGEFTKRAFLNHKLDLTEAEAIADLIHAQTSLQRTQALSQLGGDLKNLYDRWRDDLIHAAAYLSAHLDFPDEDLPDTLMDQVRPVLDRLTREISAHLDDGRCGEILREGLNVVILGPPNAGKSSFLNALARREAAIVSPVPGTTRDLIDVHLDLGGYPVLLTDTAGLRDKVESHDGQGGIEAMGMDRALARARSAHLKIVMMDVGSGAGPALSSDLLGQIDENTIVVANKIDLGGSWPSDIAGHRVHPVSVQSGEGLPALLCHLENRIAGMFGLHEGAVLTRARHRTALSDCLSALVRTSGVEAPELVAEEARHAIAALGRLTGRIDVEDLLDVIFRDFCIGK